jgi:hypothetical protein
MKILTGRPILATFLPPQNHQNQQQQNFGNFANQHSRSRGVAKIRFGTPMLHGKRFFVCFSCSMGVRFLHFATPLEREGDFFHLFNTSPARITKMKKIAIRSHVVEASARKV